MFYKSYLNSMFKHLSLRELWLLLQSTMAASCDGDWRWATIRLVYNISNQCIINNFNLLSLYPLDSVKNLVEMHWTKRALATIPKTLLTLKV